MNITRRGFWFGLALLAWAACARTSLAASPAPASRPATVPSAAAVVSLSGEVNDFQRNALKRHIAAARAAGADTVILKINTWGGLVTSGLDIARFLRNLPDLRTVAYVDEKAISAGAMIALACDEIVMGPGATLGDSAPIAASGDGIINLSTAERAKAESPILADFYESAVRNGYDPLLVQSMVSVGRVVHWVQSPDGGQRKFVTGEDYAKLTADGWTPVPGVRDPVDGPDTLLTVGTDEAVKLGLASGTAPSAEALAASLNLPIIAAFEPGAGERALALLSNAAVRAVLMSIFLFAFYAAIHAPGHGMPEVIAVSALAVLIGVPVLTGYAQWWEVAAILVGVGLLALEIFVIPGFGVAGVAGLLLVLFGLVMSFVGHEPRSLPGVLPSLPATWAAIQKALIVLTAGLAGSLFLWAWLSRYLPKLPYVNRLILATDTSDVAAGAAPGIASPPPDWVAEGSLGRAVTDLRPSGRAAFFDPVTRDDRLADVVSDAGFVRAGSPVQVKRVDAGTGRVLVVPQPQQQAVT